VLVQAVLVPAVLVPAVLMPGLAHRPLLASSRQPALAQQSLAAERWELAGVLVWQ
jgi:hypothetical protein